MFLLSPLRNFLSASKLTRLLALGLVLSALWVGHGYAQNKGVDNKKRQKELEAQRKKKEKEIEVTKQLLNQTATAKTKSITQLRLLNKQISVREALIQTVAQELDGVDAQLESKKQEIEELKNGLKVRKEEYAEMVYLAYKKKRLFDPLTFVLSSRSFHQATRRISFIRSLSASRTLQMGLIRQAQENLELEVINLENIKVDKTQLLIKQQEEKQALETDKKEGNALVSSLQKKEKDLRKQLEAHQKAAKKLNAEIDRIIREEIERARKEEEERRKKAGGTEKTGTTLKMTPEAAALSANFNSNKGKLPWPVETGSVIKGFGEHRHPTLANVKTVNNGIDIVTNDGSQVRAVFQGEVRAIFSVPGMQNAVMVNHGEFFTVYTHLDVVHVKKGDKVSTKQNIGTVYKDPNEGKSIVHFELWQGNTKQDPESWLFNK